MDPTLQVLLAAALGALVAGGAVLAWHVSDRQQHTARISGEPVLQPAVAQVLSVLRSSAVVVDGDDDVLKASAPAYALGLVRGQRLRNEELADVIRAVRRDGQIRETEIVMHRGPMPSRTVTARVAPLGTKLVLALVEDRTRERQVEAIRRDFVANISHELKTPVGAIRILAEALQDASDDPEAVERFSGRMLTETERLSRLISQVIELQRLQGDDPVDQPERVLVEGVVQQAVDISSTDAQAKRIRIVTECEPQLLTLGNRGQITAAVSNLVANAVAYSDHDSTVTVRAKRAGSDVEISVIDQGIGIPSEELERIFERFYRVDPARHRSTGGTGLGLSIVKHVAATHGGDVRVWSMEGQGSTFTLILPLHAAATSAGTGSPVLDDDFDDEPDDDELDDDELGEDPTHDHAETVTRPEPGTGAGSPRGAAAIIDRNHPAPQPARQEARP